MRTTVPLISFGKTGTWNPINTPYLRRLYCPSRSAAKSTHHTTQARGISVSTQPRRTNKHADASRTESPSSTEAQEEDEGAMTRRLQHLSTTDLSGTRKEDIEAAGFSEELKKDLLERIAASRQAGRSRYPSAFASAEAPSSAGQGSRDIAAAQPWTGSETASDAALRMLDDAHKRVRAPNRFPGAGARPPKKVDTGRPGKGDTKARKSGSSHAGTRLANARDRTSVYGYLKDESLSQEEREKMRKELKDRFTPGARPMPTTLQGLTSLANERIEDAIARGQFKDLPSRGKKLERDYNASSPFLDTTEYFMNKIIQKQEIVPPWIERQQDLVSSANRFRARLRSDWRRHAARMISSAGGNLDAQVQRAERYAESESALNPQPRKREEKLNTVDAESHMSQISLAGELRPPRPEASGPPDDLDTMTTQVTVTPQEELEKGQAESSIDSSPTSRPTSQRAPTPLFRDPDWEHTELSYHQTAVNDLNALTRTYNLMAPDLAKKPYFSLDRELKTCYADVAPTLAHEIKERALARVRDPAVATTGNASVLESFGGGGHVAKVRDENEGRQYGFKQFWRDVFGRKNEVRT